MDSPSSSVAPPKRSHFRHSKHERYDLKLDKDKDKEYLRYLLRTSPPPPCKRRTERLQKLAPTNKIKALKLTAERERTRQEGNAKSQPPNLQELGSSSALDSVGSSVMDDGCYPPTVGACGM